jgi:hypothetical protein
MTHNDDDLPPTDPAESLALIQRQRDETERLLTPDPRLFYWPWGVAWFLGFALYFLRFGPDGRVFVDMPSWLPLTVLLTLIFAAGILSGVNGARAGRQVSGPTSEQGLMYGITWSVAFAGMAIVLSQVSNALPPAESNLLWAGAMVALTGALHMVGGAVFRDRTLFALGLWTSIINVVGVVFGSGWHSLIVAVGGGGGMFLFGYLSYSRLPK